MEKQLDKLLQNIQLSGNFSYTDSSPQRLRINIQALIDDGYVSKQGSGPYTIQITDAGTQYLQSLLTN